MIFFVQLMIILILGHKLGLSQVRRCEKFQGWAVSFCAEFVANLRCSECWSLTQRPNCQFGDVERENHVANICRPFLFCFHMISGYISVKDTLHDLHAGTTEGIETVCYRLLAFFQLGPCFKTFMAFLVIYLLGTKGGNGEPNLLNSCFCAQGSRNRWSA